MVDRFKTIESTVTSRTKEKMSKFIAFALPVTTEEEVHSRIAELQKEYFNARHICWAYMLGAERKEFRSNDNGEPSGTAGKPILGQINSFGLTNILVAVVRYFGGIKLGTGGLITAYKEAAFEALSIATIIEQEVREQIEIPYRYDQMNDIMRIIKEESLPILSHTQELTCILITEIRLGEVARIHERIRKALTGY